jgi:hypothetical protein
VVGRKGTGKGDMTSPDKLVDAVKYVWPITTPSDMDIVHGCILYHKLRNPTSVRVRLEEVEEWSHQRIEAITEQLEAEGFIVECSWESCSSRCSWIEYFYVSWTASA